MGGEQVKEVGRRKRESTRQIKKDKNKKQGFLGRTGGFPGEMKCSSRGQRRRGEEFLNEKKEKQKRKNRRQKSREKKIFEQAEIKIRSFPGVVAFLTSCWGTASSSLEAT